MSKKGLQNDKRTYITLGVIFLGVGGVFLLSGSSGTVGIVFAILGATFLILGLGSKVKKP